MTSDFFANSVLMTDEVSLSESEESSEEEYDIDKIFNMLNPEEPTSDTVCSACKSDLIEIDGVLMCSSEDCGLVESDMVDTGPEWRNPEGAVRGGGQTNYFFPQMTDGTTLSGLNNKQLNLKQKWICGNYRDQRLSYIFSRIDNLKKDNDIPKSVIEDTKIYYKILSECTHRDGENKGKYIILRGDNVDNILAACMSKAGENNHWPMSVNEIANIFGITSKRVTSGKKKFDKIIDTTDNVNQIFLDELANISALHNVTSDYISRYGPKVGLIGDALQLALRISDNCLKLRLGSNHSENSLASGIILMILNNFMSAEEVMVKKALIAECFAISEATINKVSNQLDIFYHFLINDEATEYLLKNYDDVATSMGLPKK